MKLNDNDADKSRWSYYKVRYPKLKIDENKVSFRKDRGYWLYEYSENSLELSGDYFFNFNEKKKKQFKSIIENDVNASEELKKNVQAALEEAVKKHSENSNCVLMPVTGGMNNLKGKLCYHPEKEKFIVAGIGRPRSNTYDRPDVFICILNEFYGVKDKVLSFREMLEYFENCIFSEALKTFNSLMLYDFLKRFSDVYAYCDFFFGIDQVFVDKMLNQGQKPINDVASLEEYISLANEFWSVQKKIFIEEKNKLDLVSDPQV